MRPPSVPFLAHPCGRVGERDCGAAAGGDGSFDPKELICPSCAAGDAAQVRLAPPRLKKHHGAEAAPQICPKHGTDFLEYKCRYCCSVAVWFCFGTTHFCEPCHNAHSQLIQMAQQVSPPPPPPIAAGRATDSGGPGRRRGRCSHAPAALVARP